METFLIVDDEKNILKMLSQGLKMRGYQALTAASGEEALKQAMKTDVDLVLLDIRMENGMDGIQTLVKLRERYPELNVVMMSAQQDIEIAVNNNGTRCETVYHETDWPSIKFYPASSRFLKYHVYRKKNEILKSQITRIDEMVGDSAAISHLRSQIERVAGQQTRRPDLW